MVGELVAFVAGILFRHKLQAMKTKFVSFFKFEKKGNKS